MHHEQEQCRCNNLLHFTANHKLIHYFTALASLKKFGLPHNQFSITPPASGRLYTLWPKAYGEFFNSMPVMSSSCRL